MSIVHNIENALLPDFRAISGIEQVLATEPRAVPRLLPVVTWEFAGGDPVMAETGPGDDTTYAWLLRLYVRCSDMSDAQDSFKTLVPPLLAVPRSNPRADDTADILSIRSAGEGPEYVIEEGYAVMGFVLTARLTET